MNFNVNHIMLDIETLASSEKCVIPALSALIFNFELDKDATYDELVDRTLFVKFDIKDQIKKYSRVTDKQTLNFWKSQSEDARAYSVKESDIDVSADIGLITLKEYLYTNGYDFKNSYIWSRGNGYDQPKLESFISDIANNTDNEYGKQEFKNNDDKYILNFWKFRDSKTYTDLIGNTDDAKYYLEEGNPKNFTKHHAQHDSALEVFKMLRMYH